MYVNGYSYSNIIDKLNDLGYKQREVISLERTVCMVY